MGIKVKYRIINFLEDNIGENLGNLMNGNDFLNIKPEILLMKGVINKKNHIRIRSFCCVKDTIKRMGGKMTQSSTKNNNQIQKQPKTWHFSKDI